MLELLVTFNMLQGVFWLALAFVIVFYLRQGVPQEYEYLAMYTVLTLIVFGLSEFAEFIVGNDMQAIYSLFVIKTLCIFALATAVGWYVHVSLYERHRARRHLSDNGV